MKTKIKLHGKLSKLYGEEFEFDNIKKPEKPKGEDLVYHLSLTLEEIAFGTIKKIKLDNED